jgi:hypothetical protein
MSLSRTGWFNPFRGNVGWPFHSGGVGHLTLGPRTRGRSGLGRGRLPMGYGDECLDCDITSGAHICSSCLARDQYFDSVSPLEQHYACSCVYCDFCGDDYGHGSYGGGGHGAYHLEPRM